MLYTYPYFSRERIKYDLNELGAALRKSKGQNFLIDPNSVSKIIQPIESTYNHFFRDSQIVEIGPGLGALTHRLVEFAQTLAIEVDPVFVILLKRLFQHNKNFQIIEGDARQILANKMAPMKSSLMTTIKAPIIVGNLPYYISTELILASLEIKEAQYFFFLVQSEFANRLSASNAISSITVYVQNLVKVEQIHKVPPTAFFPTPKVNSTIFSMARKTDPVSPIILEKLLRMSYRSKRKKLRNSWQIGEAFFPIELLEDLASLLNIDTEKRPEQIEIQAFHQLSKLIDQNIK